MALQGYSNHSRYYPPHHFVFYPVTVALTSVAIWATLRANNVYILGAIVTLALVLLIWLSWMLRQHYALTLQNRIVIVELRLRYYILTQRRFEDVERRLTPSQVFALRFASDEELEALTLRALSENLSADDIKKSVKTWLPDHKRV